MQLDGMEDDALRGNVRAPDLCRLTILAQHTQVDLAVPVDVPVALLIPGIIDMIAGHGRNNDFDNTGEQVEPREWVLARVGRPPLSSTLSLGEHGVRDGELLMLESADHTAPPPLFDDIMYNVAMADADRYQRWTPGVARLIGSVIAATTTVAGCFALLWSGVGDNDLIGGIVALLVSILFLVAGIVTSRVYGDTATSLVLSGCALPTAFAAGVLFVPDDWSWAHLLLGTALTGAVAILALRVGGVGLAPFTGVAVVALFLVPGAVVGTLIDQPVRVVTAVLAAVALGALALAPRLSMLLAKLPLPQVPTAGTSVDPAEADPSDNQAMPSFDELNAKAGRARQYLAGLVGATMVVTVGGAVTAALPVDTDNGIYWPGTALALVCAVVLMFRGRTYANAEEAVPLIAGGAVILVALLVGAGVVVDQASLGVFAAAIVVALAALGLGIIAPAQTATPPMRRAVELLEYGFIAAVVPLVCWVANLYAAMRGL